MMYRYRLPISFNRNRDEPRTRSRQAMGTTAYVYPRTMAFSGSSTVKLKCGDSRGRQPAMTSAR